MSHRFTKKKKKKEREVASMQTLILRTTSCVRNEVEDEGAYCLVKKERKEEWKQDGLTLITSAISRYCPEG